MNKKRYQQTVWDAINVNVDIDYYVRLIWARKWPIVAFGLLVTSFILWYFSSRPDEYSATSSLLIESNIPRTMTMKGVYNPDASTPEYFTTQVELLKSRKLTEAVINELDLWKNPELAVPNLRRLLEFHALTWLEKFGLHSDNKRIEEIKALALDKENVLYAFSKRLSVIPVRHSKVIKISYRSADPELSAKVANMVTAKYTSLMLDFRNEVSQLAYEEYVSKLRETTSIVENLKSKIAALVKGNPQTTAIQSEEFQEYNRQYLTEKLVNEKHHIEELESRLTQVLRALQSPLQEELNLPELGAAISELQRRYFETKYQRKLLLKELQPEHPSITELDAKLASIKSLFRDQLKKIPPDIRQKIRDAKNRYRKTRAELTSLENSRLDEQTGQHDLERLKAKLDKYENIRQTLDNKVKEWLELKNSLYLVARVIDRAEPPVRPVGPRKIVIGALSLILGVSFSSMYFVFKDLFDTRVKYAKRFELASGEKNLACIPRLKDPFKFFKDCRKAESPKPLNRKERAFLEAFRTFKANLTLELIQQQYKSILITSSTPNEGKTITSLWLANTFASSEKVLLVDADIRRFSLTSHLGCESKKGLINALNDGGYELKTIGASQGIFDFLPAGSAKVDPSAYFSKDSFQHFIEKLSSKYERIIIDTSPICAVSDAVLLARQVDAIVLVTRSSMTEQKVALQSIEKLAHAKGRVIGFVITDIDEKYYRHLTDYASYQSYDKYYAHHDL